MSEIFDFYKFAIGITNICNFKAQFGQLQICTFIHSGILGACTTSYLCHTLAE